MTRHRPPRTSSDAAQPFPRRQEPSSNSEMSMDDIAALLDELDDSGDTRRSRAEHSWWDSAEEMRRFLREVYRIDASTVEYEPSSEMPRIHLDQEHRVFSLNLDAIDTISPVTRFTVGRQALTVDSQRPYGAFTEPRVQIPSARIFGLIHLGLAQHRYTTWTDRIAHDAEAEVRDDAAAVDSYDRARAQCLAANGSVWMHPVLQAGYGLWITDPATHPQDTAAQRLEWLVTRIILLEEGGLLPTEASLPATHQVTKYIGSAALDEIITLFRSVAHDINPKAETMLAVGHRLRLLWARIDSELAASGTLPSDIDIAQSAQFATDSLTTQVKQRLDVLSRRWRIQPWPNEHEDSLFDDIARSAPQLGESSADVSRRIINDDQWGSLTGTLDVDMAPVTDTDRAMTTRIRAALDRARTRKLDVGSVPSTTPGGRINTRQLVQMQAQIAAGRQVTATPWSRRHSHQHATPDIHVAMVCDVSRSMGMWNRTTGPLAWSLINAVDQLGGSAAAWGFDGKVAPIARTAAYYADQVPHLVGQGSISTMCAEALAEACRDAGFAQATGAKIALIVTDGVLGEDEFTEIQKEVSRQVRHGVSVYWVSAGIVASAGWAPTGAHRLTLTDADRFADEVISTVVASVANA